MVSKSYRGWLFALALIGAAVDLGSKYGVFRWLGPQSSRFDDSQGTGDFTLIPNAFRLHVQYSDQPAEGTILRRWSSDRMPRVNHGALFGLGNEREGGANSIFAVISVLAAIGIGVWSFRATTRRDRLLCIALGLILAGTIGNLFDRIVFGGVRDFLYWNYLVDWPVFNIADCCLVCGALSLLAHAFLTNPDQAPATEAASHATPAASAGAVAAPEVAQVS